MNPDRVLRVALWASVPANLGVAALLLDPGSALGQFVGLPEPAPEPFYRGLLAQFVALFGAAYAWLAMQPQISRPFIAFAAIGKFGAFILTFVLCFLDLASTRWTMLMAGDLLFAAVFAWWLVTGEAPVISAMRSAP